MSAPAAEGSSIPESLAKVIDRIKAAARRAKRDPDGVTLIGITKTMPASRVAEAVAAGLRHIGENRVQEAAGKREELGPLPGVTWHLVGHLQSNKARKAAELFDVVHSIDGEKLARHLSEAATSPGDAPEARRGLLDALIQVDLGGEPTKFGVEPKMVELLAVTIRSLPGLRLRGLMIIPPQTPDPEGARPYFRRLRELRERLARAGADLPDLSMGMTGDFEVAIEEGATMVRVGRAIFGERG